VGDPGIVVQPVGEGNFEASVQFLIGWVSDGAAEARAYLADHAEPAGASLIAVHGDDVAGYGAILWESNFAGFRDRGIPLVHQLAVAGPFRRQGVATLLMDAAEQLAASGASPRWALRSACSTSTARLSGCAGSAAMSLTAGAHAAPSDRSARECTSSWTTT
jgi:GNAT superfamily N-acetyltransferase